MELKLDNVLIVASDLNKTGDPKQGNPQTFRLSQSRLAIFFSEVDTGRPLAGWPVFVFLELDIRRLESTSDGAEYQELNPHVYSARLPLGLLATDHVGYVSYDLTIMRDLSRIALVDQSDALPLKVTTAEATTAAAVFGKEPVQLSVKAIWIHPYGTFPFDGLKPGLFSLRPDAIVVNALLEDRPSRTAGLAAGIPSLQEPSIVDWRLSPGSFAVTPGVRLGDEDCERFTPANMAVETYYFNRVVLDRPSPLPRPPSIVNSAPGIPTPPPPFAPSSAPAGPPVSPAISPGAVGPLVSFDAAESGATAPVLSAPPLTAFGGGPQPDFQLQPQATVLNGSIFIYRTSWFQLGHSLGKILYTLALAPGENRDIAVIDWSREDTAARTETTAVSEALIADLRRDRLIGETIDGILNEKQSGGSTIGAGSLVGGIAGSTGAVGAMAGLGLSLGGGSAWTEGHRDLHDSTVQMLSDRIQQSSSALRELRSTVVVSSHQREQNAITTKNVTNYNHSHTLTILYYELLRHLRVVTSFDRGFDATLVRFPRLPLNTSKPESLLPLAPFLKDHLLDATLATALDALTQLDLEMRRSDPQAQPTPEQSLRIRRVIGTLGIKAQVHVDANNHGIALALARVPPPDDVIACIEPSQFTVTTTFETQVPVLNDVWMTVPKFENNKDDQLRTEQLVSFVMTPKDQVDWTDLDGLKVQCLFQGPDNAQQFVVRLADAVAITDDQPVDVNAGEPATYLFQGTDWSGRKVNALSGSDRRVTGIGEFAFKRPPLPKAARAPFDRLTPEQQAAILRLVGHVEANIDYYSTVYWIVNDEARVTSLQAMGTSFDASYWPVTTLGTMLVFPKLVSRPVLPDDVVADERLITLPTRGVFADAKLGECNVSEVIDNTRFWDWQQSPIPFRSPDITGVTPTSPAQQPQGLQPTPLPAPLVSIQAAPAAPDPAVAAGLTALTTPNIFRDMSIASQVASVMQQVTDAAKQVAIAAGSLVKVPDSQQKQPSGQGGASGGGTNQGTGGGSQAQAPTGQGDQQQTSPTSQTGQSTQGTLQKTGPAPVTSSRGATAQQSSSNSNSITFVFQFDTNDKMFGSWTVYLRITGELDPPISSSDMIDTTGGGYVVGRVGNRMEIQVPSWFPGDRDVTVEIAGTITQLPRTTTVGSYGYTTNGWDWERSFTRDIKNAVWTKTRTFDVIQPTDPIDFSISITESQTRTEAEVTSKSAGLEIALQNTDKGGLSAGLEGEVTFQVTSKGTFGYTSQLEDRKTSEAGTTSVYKFTGRKVSPGSPVITPV